MSIHSSVYGFFTVNYCVCYKSCPCFLLWLGWYFLNCSLTVKLYNWLNTAKNKAYYGTSLFSDNLYTSPDVWYVRHFSFIWCNICVSSLSILCYDTKKITVFQYVFDPYSSFKIFLLYLHCYDLWVGLIVLCIYAIPFKTL